MTPKNVKAQYITQQQLPGSTHYHRVSQCRI